MLLLEAVVWHRLGGLAGSFRVQTLWVGVAFSLVSACVQPSVRSIVGPDGRATLFVTCGETGDCYQLAGSYCPHGYNIQRARGATPESYLVSCRTAVAGAPEQYYYAPANGQPPTPAPAARAAAPAGLVPRASAAALPESSWPPSNESVDPPHPWGQHAPPPPPPPPPSSEHQALPEAQNGISLPRPISSEELDVGY